MRAPARQGGRQSGIGLRRIAGGWAAAFAAFVIVMAAFWAITAWHDRRLSIENAEHEAAATARLMAAHAERAIEVADKVLLAVLTDRTEQAVAQIDRRLLHRQISSMIAQSPQISAGWMVDAEGQLLVNDETPDPPPQSFADREYFRLHRVGRTALQVEAEYGPVPATHRVTLSRSWHTEDGGFLGVLAIGIRSDYFSDLYREAEISPQARSSLHLLDGRLLASWPPMERQSDLPWLDELRVDVALGPGVGTMLRDDEDRLILSWQRLSDLPLFVAVARPSSAALADWRERTLFGGLLALSAIGGFGVIAWRGWRGARAEAEAQQALREAYRGLDRRIAERTAELAESEALAQRRLLELEALYADAPIGLALYDRELRLVRINEELARAIGLTVAESLGRPLSELMPDASRVSAGNVRAVFETGEALAGVELRGRSRRVPQIQRVWIEDYYPVRDATGHVVAVGVIYRDISERVRAEDALRESDKRMQLAQEAGGMGLWDWDMKTGESVRSDSYYRVWGLPPERFERTSSFLDLVLPADRPRAAADIAAAMENGKPYHSEFRVPQPDGAIRWLELRGEVRRDETGDAVRMIGVCFDITARKQAEERMKMLAAEVDHRSKNVLAIVQSMLQLTRARTVEEFRAAVHGRVAALGRAHGLLSESRWEGAELRRIVEDELAPFRSADGSRVQVTGNALLLPPGVAQALSVALHELATNAAKYGALSAGGGRVAVEWVVTDGWLRLSWHEQGGPPVVAPRRRGFGSMVIERIVKAQLEGDVRFDWRPSGLLCAIAVPLQRGTDGLGVSAA